MKTNEIVDRRTSSTATPIPPKTEPDEVGTPYGTGWVNEFVVAYATGAGPREAPSQERLAGIGGSASLTEQLPTMTELEADEETEEAIDAAQSIFNIGVDTESGGDQDESGWLL